ncbi:mRNA cleavage factor complex component pcf11 [Colletotrichum truncatum]|uniref:mRNA cleavage factor complex component pcf11 n=1 Tax=Colletotrichum truncatum TaxID=5467 RepID=A0ACC3Z9G5_COLTU|nr:mRNA cleavage factor complex component pcf11 [Colletotrichum truncatum]KAF6793620.1 mRNA cleavage factor complex component pcf11 [Colletotrichum truncatum]
MSYEASAAEVAEDYRQALEDLTTNVRFEISNLTMIAREQTEHAQVISEVLQDHILKAPAHKKLPALYVLDSIVKNVGTPYTLFFGSKLYQTFMEAYAAVDGQVRRKMDEMLRTWKEPVPGSLDKRPVFAPEVTQPIESALMKARTSALQAQQGRGQLGRGRPGAPYRETPTPPGVRPGSNQPGPYGVPPPMQQPNGNRAPSAPLPHHPQMTPYAPPPASYSAQPPSAAPGPYQPPPQMPQMPQMPHAAGLAGPPQAGGISIDSLGQDIQKLIDASKLEFAQNPHDHSVQQRLKALLDVQSLLQHQNLPQDQLVLIKNQVADLAVKVRPFSAQGPVPAATPVPHHPPPAAAAPVVPPSAPPQQPGGLTLDSLFGQGTLAALLSRQSATPQAPTPTPPPPFPNMAIRSPPPQRAEPVRQPSAPPATDPMALLAGLRQAGLLPGGAPSATPTPVPPVPAAPAPPPGMPMLPPGLLPPNIASLLAGMPRPPPPNPNPNQLDATALKQQYQPHLISSLYEKLGPQCTQCGRRFQTDEEGRKKKMAHMDWHFKAHQRLAEAEKRGQHRSWYVDNNDWLKSREAIDVDHVPPTDNSSSSPGREKKEAKPKYIPVPDASSGINSVCPICQEKFENKWLDTAQEWVWLDTILVGNRAFHYSCHAEATQARESTPVYSRGTPEPVLGKRKAEDDLKSLRGKLKMDDSKWKSELNY